MHLQTEVVDYGPEAAGRIARTEIAVDIVLGEAGILNGAFGDLGMGWAVDLSGACRVGCS